MRQKAIGEKMKRSEAVRDLAIMLMGRLPEWEKQERLNFADEILEQLEIMGMQPPNVTLDELIPSSGLSVIGDKHYYACWEDE
jgi:hypothetical protein